MEVPLADTRAKCCTLPHLKMTMQHTQRMYLSQASRSKYKFNVYDFLWEPTDVTWDASLYFSLYMHYNLLILRHVGRNIHLPLRKS